MTNDSFRHHLGSEFQLTTFINEAMPVRKTAYLSHVMDTKIVVKILAAKISDENFQLFKTREDQEYCSRPVPEKTLTKSNRISKGNQ